MKALKTVAIVFVIIGTIGIAINMLFGYNTISFLQRQRVEQLDVWIWQFDALSYIKNIETSINDLSRLQLQLPTRQWIYNADLTNWPIVLMLNMGTMVDYIILVLNILLYPLKVGAYVVRQILAFIGVNILDTTNNPMKWLIDFVNNIMNASIPYI